MARSWLTGFALASLVFEQGLSLLLFPAILWLAHGQVKIFFQGAKSWQQLVLPLFLLCGFMWGLSQQESQTNRPSPPTSTFVCSDHGLKYADDHLHIIRHAGLVRYFQLCIWRQKIVRFIRHASPKHQQFLVSVLAGEKSALDFQTQDSFRRLGIFHLLVVSGTHVSLLAGFLQAFFIIFLNTLGSVRVLSPGLLLRLRHLMIVIILILVLAYCEITGMGAAAQRAFFVFALHSILTKILHRRVLPPDRIFLTMAAQSFWFPGDFFTGGNLLSWMAYLMIITFPARSRGGMLQACIQAFVPQVCISLIVLALFGEFAMLGIFANFLIIPLFSGVMTKTYALLLLSLAFSSVLGRLDELLSWLLNGISYLAVFTYKFNVLYLVGFDLPIMVKIILVHIGLILLSTRFNSCRYDSGP